VPAGYELAAERPLRVVPIRREAPAPLRRAA
jgi:hypothetical protein